MLCKLPLSPSGRHVCKYPAKKRVESTDNKDEHIHKICREVWCGMLSVSMFGLDRLLHCCSTYQKTKPHSSSQDLNKTTAIAGKQSTELSTMFFIGSNYPVNNICVDGVHAMGGIVVNVGDSGVNCKVSFSLGIALLTVKPLKKDTIMPSPDRPTSMHAGQHRCPEAQDTNNLRTEFKTEPESRDSVS